MKGLKSIKNIKIVVLIAIFFNISACVSMRDNAGVRLASEDTGSKKEANRDEVMHINEITPQLVQSEHEVQMKKVSENLQQLVKPAVPYVVESGDVLSIIVWDHPELNGGNTALSTSSDNAPYGSTPTAGFMVDQEGSIHFPFAGSLKVSGLTEEQVRDQLVRKLSRYIKNPNVSVRVELFRSKRVYVDGEVKQPGSHAINDIPMTLIEAINRAGGMLPTADQSRIALTRDKITYEINLTWSAKERINIGSILLQNGDVLRVPSRDESKVFVSGEVIAPRSMTMHDGRLSLNEALGEAGGLNPISGDASQVFVIRHSQEGPKVYRLDARTPDAYALAEKFDLDPKDVVYVAAAPLTNWYRTISQIFPGSLSSSIVRPPAR